MSRVAYLHVGAPKTGTTYLQDRVLKNREQLAEHGFHYPVGLGTGHFMAALDLLEMEWGGQGKHAAGQWDSLANRVNRIDGDCLISHEILAAAKPDQVQRAVDSLDVDEMHIIYTARDLTRQIPAEWQESVKHRRRHTYQQFLDQILETQSRPSAEQWFWRVQGIPEVLSRWGAHVPPGNVHLVMVPPPGAPRELLWERFCQVLNIDPLWAPEESNKANQSIGGAETTLLRQLNVRLRGDLESAPYRMLVRQLMVHRTLAHRKNMNKVTLPPRLEEWAANLTEEWLGWIEDSGIDVVGDVDELRPHPVNGAEWLDPDRPNPEDMVDAALDALVAMTKEAARRGGGNRPDSFRRKVKKAVTRARMSRH